MPTILIWAIILITIALIGYSWSIFSINRGIAIERKQEVPLILSWLCDFSGTVLFFILGKQYHVSTVSLLYNIHVWLGYLVLAMMLVLVLWTAHVCYHHLKLTTVVRRYSVIAWLLWVVDYLTGMFVH